MVPFKGRLGIKQLFFTNLFVSVSDHESATGCCCKFDICGKSKKEDDPLALGKSAAVVTNLVKGLEHKNYNVYMDNYYTSVPLFLSYNHTMRFIGYESIQTR